MTGAQQFDLAIPEIELDITGMTCASCANRIERKLNKLDDTQASVNYATEKATVRSSHPVISELIETIKQAGYDATEKTWQRPNRSRPQKTTTPNSPPCGNA